MAYEQRESDIAVFLETKKTNDRAPDWKGRALVNGVEMEVALWRKTDTMLAGSIKLPRDRQEREAITVQHASRRTEDTYGPLDDEDGVPF